MASLNDLKKVRRILVWSKWFYLTKVWGMDIDKTVEMSLSARFDKTYPKGIHVGPQTYVAFDAAILAHDTTRKTYRHTRIGSRCFIGARSIILPGVTIGDSCIIGSGSVVTKDIPANSIVAGNPAQIIRSGVELEPYGRMPS